VFAGGEIVGGEIDAVGALTFAVLAREAIQSPQRQELPASALGDAERLSGVCQITHMNLHVHDTRFIGRKGGES
jgi:hypothetical protein